MSNLRECLAWHIFSLNSVRLTRYAMSKLEAQRNQLAEQLNRETLSPEKINRLKELAKKVGVGLELASDDFTLRKAIIDLLDVKVRLIREGDNKAIAYVTCFLKDTNWYCPQLHIEMIKKDVEDSLL